MDVLLTPLITHAPGMVGLIIVVAYFLKHMRWQGEQLKEDRSATREVLGQINQTLSVNNSVLATTVEHARTFDAHMEHIRSMHDTVKRIEPALKENTQVLGEVKHVLNRTSALIKHEETHA